MQVKPLLAVLVVAGVALAGCASDEDKDRDGVPDRQEERGWEAIVYGMEESRVITFQSDPTKEDTDGDGLTDWDETWVRGQIGPRLDPSNPDTDGDGLTDCQEWYIQLGDRDCPVPDGFKEYDYRSYQTDPSFADSDFPSHSRYLAQSANDGEGYLDHEGFQTSNGIYIWGDGISDGDEIFGYDVEQPDGTVLHVTSDPSALDTDGDELEDAEEALLFGSDPRNPDTDGDGCMDGSDIFPARVDAYRIVIDRIVVDDSPSADGSARLMIPVAIAASTSEDTRFYPSEGHESVDEGEEVSLNHLAQEPVLRKDCTSDPNTTVRLASPFQPWVLVQVSPLHKTDGASQDNRDAFRAREWEAIDTASDSAPDGAIPDRVFWNPREDVYRWQMPESPSEWTLEGDPDAFSVGADGWLHQEGPDGELWFRAEVHLS